MGENVEQRSTIIIPILPAAVNIGREQLDQLGAALGDGLIVGTPEGAAISVSPHANDLLGLPRHAAPDAAAARLTALFGASPLALAARGPFTHSGLRLTGPDGAIRHVRVSGLPLDGSGALAALVLCEISPLPPLAAPPELDPEIRRLHQLRDEILSIASHELKNPLTVILGYSRLLASDQQVRATPRLARATEAIRQQSQRMRRMVEQLLDFTRLGLGQLTVQRAAFDLADQVRTIAAQHSTLRIPLQASIPSEPLLVLGDAMRIERVLATLLSDALLHDQRPRAVEVTVRRTHGSTLPADAYGGPPSPSPYALVCVHDPSLPPEAVDYRSFARYAPPDSWDVPQADHWLGLYVGAQVIALHSGLIWAEPHPGAGGVIAYALPLIACVDSPPGGGG